MKASELIVAVQQFVAMKGDCDVVISMRRVDMPDDPEICKGGCDFAAATTVECELYPDGRREIQIRDWPY